MPKGITRYSQCIKGTARNYNWSVSFDDTDGYVGINQLEGERVKDRILLSPAQVKAMTKFVQSKDK